MDIKCRCPNCGAHTVVQITQEEKDIYFRRGRKLPVDFNDRAVCMCCLDDGYKFAGDQFSSHNLTAHI